MCVSLCRVSGGCCVLCVGCWVCVRVACFTEPCCVSFCVCVQVMKGARFVWTCKICVKITSYEGCMYGLVNFTQILPIII